ncbi:HD family phosphohydrolase [Heyndrickxia acidicola]|uniref:HD family phosphohydrolase n=1 Tax=Heyndrickxia acidicola TaxID=209389 RepID=A0ABU6MLB9_9BACI|nr:HD family phosphohydrolase [Heyndrickxia acidicola]MED1205094.1 HD family phosphohydrolase [Heyndrickxia acidicola]
MKIQTGLNRIQAFLGTKVFNTLIFILLALLLFGVLYQNIKPQTYNMELFSVADKTVRSPKTIEDQAKTDEEKQKAALEAGQVYTYNKDMVYNRVSLINSIFDFVVDINQNNSAVSNNTDQKKKSPTMSEKLSRLKTSLSANVNENVTKSLPDDIFEGLLEADNNELEQARNIVINQIEFFMNDKIRENKVLQVKEMISDKIDHYNLNGSLRRSAVELGKYAIVPNDLYDADLTAERKKEAMDNVEPIKILQGQVIVQEGQLIDRETYRQLELLGLLTSHQSIKPFVGLAVFVLLIIGGLYIYFAKMRMPEEKKQNELLMLSFIFIISLILMKIVSLTDDLNLPEAAYIFPAALAPMLLRFLVNERFAFIVTIFLAACGSIVFHDEMAGTINVEMALYILFSGTAGILFLTNQKLRSNILQSGIFISCANVLVIFFLILIGNGQYNKMEYVYYIIFAFGSGILSSILTMGLLPFFEALFGILSTMRLIELSNPNHPLLKRILTEAPGTYHHSLMVGNLAEAACEAIGANGLLARVGCYYHDIGKTKRPHFFIENQLNIENPHDHLDPETSKEIIIAHAVDGAEMLREHRLPKELEDIAEQHHGTTLLKYFFYKAKEKDPHVDEESFRYPGPKPQTKETAVISIADSVEAAVRSMPKPNADKIKRLVNNIVQDRLEDGQLNECDITLKELEVIKKTFCETLNGIFHSRIEYPNEKNKG